MNLLFLGDALDYWKGSLLLRLQGEGLLNDLSVDPMLTDPDDWNPIDFDIYADLLHVRPDQIVQHKVELKNDRDGYFAEVISNGDLFIDPDTGIKLGNTRIGEKHVSVGEVYQLLGKNSPKILCIYQHGGYEKTRDKVRRLFTALAEGNAGIWCLSYETPTVAMLFVSKKQNRIKQVEEYFKKHLGRHSDVRVRVV